MRYLVLPACALVVSLLPVALPGGAARAQHQTQVPAPPRTPPAPVPPRSCQPPPQPPTT